jgi:hypothetical protein
MKVRALLLLAALVTAPALAHAEPSSPAMEEGRASFQKGVTLFRAGDYRGALAEFEHANAVAPSFRIRFNIGQTCAELGDHVCATKAFEAFLAEGGKQVPPAQRVTAERELKRLHALVGTLKIAVDAAGAEVAIDDVPVGTSPIADAVVVAPGKRKVSAKNGSGGTASSVVDVTAGASTDVSLVLTQATAAPPPPVADASTPSRLPFWIGVGVTGAFTVATVTFGVLSLGAKSDLNDAAARYGASKDDIDGARSTLKSRELVTDIFGGCAILAGAATAWLFFRTQPAKTTVGIGLGAVSVRHTF